MMDKTININIAGTLFQIDEEAYRILHDYLQALNNRFKNVEGGHETIEDIEFRIAEIFQAKKGLTGNITIESVKEMIAIIGKPEDFDQDEFESTQQFTSSHRKRMYRNPDDKIIGGVCGGIGAYTHTDPVLFRILFIISSFFGIGIFIYLALWIAIPAADTESRKREMYGSSYHHVNSQNNASTQSGNYDSKVYNSGYYNTTGIGNAFNEIFRALGRVLWIFLRIFLIIIGVFLVITGFLVILSFVMVFIFKFPGMFSSDGFNIHMAYYSDFLNYIVNPKTIPWLVFLSLLSILLPMLALIYLGVKMIFWFKVKDGLFILSGFIVWVISATALGLIIFNEGIGFSETGRTTSTVSMPSPHDTLYIITDKKASQLKYDKELSLPDDNYTIYMDDSLKKLYLPVRLELNVHSEKTIKAEIKKRASGRSELIAINKAESIIYNYRFSNDTLYLDNYFTFPAGSKWSADYVKINLFVPEKTVLYFDKNCTSFFDHNIYIYNTINDEERIINYDYDTRPWELGNKYWKITGERLIELKKED
jgi:phage shock protein PspC (stress-responsive transcriptional regulator)